MCYESYLSNKLGNCFVFIFGIQPLDNSTVISMRSKDFQKGKRESAVNPFGFLKSVQILSWTSVAEISSPKANSEVFKTTSDFKIVNVNVKPRYKTHWKQAGFILHDRIFFWFIDLVEAT